MHVLVDAVHELNRVAYFSSRYARVRPSHASFPLHLHLDVPSRARNGIHSGCRSSTRVSRCQAASLVEISGDGNCSVPVSRHFGDTRLGSGGLRIVVVVVVCSWRHGHSSRPSSLGCLLRHSLLIESEDRRVAIVRRLRNHLLKLHAVVDPWPVPTGSSSNSLWNGRDQSLLPSLLIWIRNGALSVGNHLSSLFHRLILEPLGHGTPLVTHRWRLFLIAQLSTRHVMSYHVSRELLVGSRRT